MSNRKTTSSASLSQGKHVRTLFVSGARGCGKSTFTMAEADKAKRLVVVDATLDYHQQKGFKLFTNIKDLARAIKANYNKPKGFKYSYNPFSGLESIGVDRSKYVDELAKLLLQVQLPYYHNKANVQILLVLEESSSACPTTINMKKEMPYFTHLIKEGRHFGINFISVDQNSTEVNKIILQNTTEKVLFKQPDMHYSYLATILQSKEFAKIAIEQPEFNYVYKKDSNLTVGKTTK